jgi:RNA polymerase sigma factor (TIGR02999 family)
MLHRPLPAEPSHPDVTALLQRWSAGDEHAAAEVLPLVYHELKHVAARQFRSERSDHTLQVTAVVHEAYLRLQAARGLSWPSRAHFFGFAAHLMRRILVDHARQQGRLKRGGGEQRVSFSDELLPPGQRSADLVALDDALAALESVDPLKARIVELRFFGGLSVEEIASQMDVSAETVGRHWRRAKAWLLRELDASAAS